MPHAAGGITAIKLEVFTDDSFPGKGPGLSPNGNFVLTEMKAAVIDPKADKKDRKTSRQELKLARASADHSQESFAIAGAIDGKSDTGWGVLPETGKPHEAVLEFDKPIVAAAGNQLELTLEELESWATETNSQPKWPRPKPRRWRRSRASGRHASRSRGICLASG